VPVVPSLNTSEDSHPGLSLGPEPAPAFKGSEEAFCQRVVVGIPDAAPGRPDALLAAAAEGQRGVLAALPRRRLTPMRLAARISRATCFCPTKRSASSRKSFQSRGAPKGPSERLIKPLKLLEHGGIALRSIPTASASDTRRSRLGETRSTRHIVATA